MYETNPFRKKYITRPYSGEKQDEFVYYALVKNMKDPGYFLDFACGHPVDHNNTYLLEMLAGWSGLAIDNSKTVFWSQYRHLSEFINGDVYDPNLFKQIKANLKTTLVDYISLDVDCAGTQLTHLAFDAIINAGVEFKCMTLEHESFKHGDIVSGPTRQILLEKGYKMLFEDVSFSNGAAFEDWWINPKYIPINESFKGLYYAECIEKLRALV